MKKIRKLDLAKLRQRGGAGPHGGTIRQKERRERKAEKQRLKNLTREVD